MFSYFFKSNSATVEEEKTLDFNDKSEDCLKLFIPGPMLDLYKELQKYIKINGKESPKSDFLPDSVTYKICSYMKLSATNQPHALSVINIIEKYLKDNLQTWLAMDSNKLTVAANFNLVELKDVYLTARQLPNILNKIPADSFPIPYLSTGSSVRKALTNLITYYEDKLKENNFPHQLDVLDDKHVKLAGMLKKY